MIVGRAYYGQNDLAPPSSRIIPMVTLEGRAVWFDPFMCLCGIDTRLKRVRGIDERMMVLLMYRAGSSGANKGSLEEVTKEFLSRRGGAFSVLC